MIHSLLLRLQKFSTLKTVVIMFALLLAVLVFVVIPPDSPVNQLSQYTHGTGILDAEFHYDANQAYRFLIAYQDYGRDLYLWRIALIDMVIPIIYSLFFATLIAFIYQRAFSATNPIQYLSLLPFVVAVADYTENIGIGIILRAYPTRLDGVATITGYITSAKSILFTALPIILLIGVVAWIWKNVRLTERTK